MLRPLWILSHLFVAVCVVALIAAGFWQLNRLQERKAANAEVLAAQDQPIAPIADLVPAGAAPSVDDVAAVEYRLTTVTGTYRPDDQVLIRNRTYQGAPGYWVLTPLVQANGTAVAVNRGWVPFAVLPEGPWDRFAPPTGTVTVTGLVREPQVRASGGVVSSPADPADGRLRTLSRVDVGRLQQQVDEPLLPVYVDLQTQQPAQPVTTPTPVPKPELSEGSHLSYAGQFFIFGALTVVVYVLLLRRVVHKGAGPEVEPDADDADDEPEPEPSTVRV